MKGFLSISLWVALVTVVPGLVTIAVVACAIFIGSPGIQEYVAPSFVSEWIIAGVAITIMILTQAAGILLEELIIKFQLFPNCANLSVSAVDDSDEETSIDAYEQYENLYVLLAQMDENDDSQGHLKRSIAQFFLTNNTLISFILGILVALVLVFSSGDPSVGLHLYLAGLVFVLIISYWVAVIRFRVMAKSIWAVRRVRKEKSLDRAF